MSKPILQAPLSVNAIRALVIDVTNKANSGHPGMAIGSATILYTLFTKYLVANPEKPDWVNRDRFVLSAGHASALLYSTLHLAGYNITMDDLKAFRQLNSITPGHPEVTDTPGVDATTGPLGQGLAQAVGMALAEEAIRAQHPEVPFFGHYTYCLVGDGCLQEGISQEAISFAGNQKLKKLIVFCDANKVTLDGPLDLSFSEDVKKRFQASGWNVLVVKNGNNVKDLTRKIARARRSKQKPTLIIVSTIIGQGSRKAGTSAVHGSPLGQDDGSYAKGTYNYPYAPFEIPNEVYSEFASTFGERAKKAEKDWADKIANLENSNNRAYKAFMAAFTDNSHELIFDEIPEYTDGFNESTRKTSGTILNMVHNEVPFLMGGSADVASSVMTKISGLSGTDFTPENRGGRNINFGIREAAMAAIQNGMLLHGGLRTYVGTFLVFSDYMKNAIRIAALSKVPAIYLFSHDTVALGEDGPTHQPIEQLAMLRATPNINVWRPADARETATAWKQAILSKETPTALILSRQNLPTLVGSNYQNAKKGGYIISKEDKKLDFTLIATGSEVSLALKAKEELLKDKIDVRVVSLPSMEIFKTQDEDYINEVLGKDYNKRIAIELLSPFGWHEFAKHTFTINRFGLSAPMKDVLESLEYTPEALANKVREILGVKKEVKKELKEDPKKEAKEETKEEPKKETEEETKEVVKEETEKEIKEEIEKEVEVKE